MKSYLVYRKANRRERKVGFEEVELSEAARFSRHRGWGSFPFTDLIFLAFVDSSVPTTMAGRHTEPSQPVATWLRYGVLARVGGTARAERRGWRRVYRCKQQQGWSESFRTTVQITLSAASRDQPTSLLALLSLQERGQVCLGI